MPLKIEQFPPTQPQKKKKKKKKNGPSLKLGSAWQWLKCPENVATNVTQYRDHFVCSTGPISNRLHVQTSHH